MLHVYRPSDIPWTCTSAERADSVRNGTRTREHAALDDTP
jgi:hypothetical protein